MSTRAIYRFIDSRSVFEVYKHCDNYPTGAAKFIEAAIPYAWPLPRFDAADFAAAFIAGNKQMGGGNVYCLNFSGNHLPFDESTLDYYYEIYLYEDDLALRAYERDTMKTKKGKLSTEFKRIFAGDLKDFILKAP